MNTAQQVTRMTKAVAQSIAGSLTVTSKMPCKSYSLPTSLCVTGSKLAKVPGSICSDCYAMKGFYKMYAKGIQKAQNYRAAAIYGPEWVGAMVGLIGKDSHFRWHDSGDIQSVQHLEQIVQVCLLTPLCDHWIPTRERGMVKAFLRAGGIIPVNLIIRMSAVMFDQVVPASIPGTYTSTVHKVGPAIGKACNATKENGCGPCRDCWDKTIPNVSYKAH
jgi:hypothetical protein